MVELTLPVGADRGRGRAGGYSRPRSGGRVPYMGYGTGALDAGRNGRGVPRDWREATMIESFMTLWEAWLQSPSYYARGVVALPVLLTCIAALWLGCRRRR